MLLQYFYNNLGYLEIILKTRSVVITVLF